VEVSSIMDKIEAGLDLPIQTEGATLETFGPFEYVITDSK